MCVVGWLVGSPSIVLYIGAYATTSKVQYVQYIAQKCVRWEDTVLIKQYDTTTQVPNETLRLDTVQYFRSLSRVVSYRIFVDIHVSISSTLSSSSFTMAATPEPASTGSTPG